MKKASALPIGLAGLTSPVPAMPPPKRMWWTHLRARATAPSRGDSRALERVNVHTTLEHVFVCVSAPRIQAGSRRGRVRTRPAAHWRRRRGGTRRGQR
eukprot:2047390-Prymnesium_polylepis.2